MVWQKTDFAIPPHWSHNFCLPMAFSFSKEDKINQVRIQPAIVQPRRSIPRKLR